jgi:hypothetical protein
MEQHYSRLALARGGSASPTIEDIVEYQTNAIALPASNLVLPGTSFGPSHAHRVWRMMNALIDAVPEWADADAFERAREKMLRHGLSRGMNLEELYALSDPDTILGLWTEAEAKDVEVRGVGRK